MRRSFPFSKRDPIARPGGRTSRKSMERDDSAEAGEAPETMGRSGPRQPRVEVGRVGPFGLEEEECRGGEAATDLREHRLEGQLRRQRVTGGGTKHQGDR